MAKQDGVLKIQGSVGDLTYFKRNGKHFVRQKGGISAERIRNDPRFARTRENMEEFRHSGKVAKHFRHALRSLLGRVQDRKIFPRLVKQFHSILKTDTLSVRGERKVQQGDLMLLKGFDFNSNSSLSSMLFASLQFGIDRAGLVATASGNLVPREDLAFPKEATHFKLSTAALVIDLANPEQQELVVATTGESVIDSAAVAIDLQASFSLDPADKVVFQLLLLEYFQQVNNRFYTLQSGSFGALQIVEVDVEEPLTP